MLNSSQRAKITNAFILTAGQGTRLRPYTDTLPKPLVPVRHKAILGQAIDKLIDFGINHITFNLHYLGDRIENYLKENYPALAYYLSKEDDLLDTGGGVRHALTNHPNDDMRHQPFFLINGDALWDDVDDAPTALTQLSNHWDSEKMDILLLLQPIDTMHVTQGVGDYNIHPAHNNTAKDKEEKVFQAVRSPDKTGAYMFTGIRITTPQIFDTAPQGTFSYRDLMDSAQKKGRLYAVIYDGQWHHISTPQDLERVHNMADHTVKTKESG